MRDGLTAAATLSVSRAAGRQRIHWTQAWPVILRPTGEHRVHLVHGAGGPLGGDSLSLEVDVGAGAALTVRSAGATLVQPGRGVAPARWAATVAVGAGGRLDWAPEATIVTDGAVLDTHLRVDLAAGARALVREVVVLGRHGRPGGRYRGELTVTVGGEVLLAHATVLDGADAALSGPGGSAGARAVGMLLLAGQAPATDRPVGLAPAGGPTRVAGPDRPVGAERVVGPAGSGRSRDGGERPGVRWAWSGLDGPGRLLLAVGDPGPVTAQLDATASELADPPVAGTEVRAAEAFT